VVEEGGGGGSKSQRLVGWRGWGGWILKRCLKVSSLQGDLDLKGGVDFSNIPGNLVSISVLIDS
jgi:hypothetical protein